MASIRRTQIRASQVTGSLGTHIADGIVDTQSNQAAANLLAVTIPSGSLSGLLSETLSAIKRLHGGTTFANNAAGTFYQSLLPSADDTHDLGSASAAWQDLFLEGDITLTDAGSVTTSAGQLTLGGAAEVFLDAATTLKLDSDTGAIQLNDGGTTRGAFQFDNEDLVLSASTQDKDLIFAGNDGGTTIEALRLDMSAAGKAIFKGDIDIAAAGAMNIGASVGANDLTIGASNSTVVVPGNLTVNGTVARVDTTNLIVKDPIVMLGSGAIGQNQQGGIAIASGSNTASQAMVFGRVANDVWGVGRKDVVDGTVSTLADMTLTALRAAQLDIGSANDNFAISSNDLVATVAQDFVVDAARDIILDANGNDIFFKANGTTIGTITNASSDLVLKQNVNAKDIIFQQDDGNEIVRLGNDRKLYFFDKGGEAIFGDGNVLNISGDDVVLDVEEELTLDAAGIVLASGSVGPVGAINFVAQDLYLSSSVSDKDMIFMVNDGGTMTEIFRLDGDVSKLRMNNKQIELSTSAGAGVLASDGTNAQATSSGIFKIESTLNNTSAIYLRENGGANGTIKIQADQGNGAESIYITSDVGGVKIEGGKDDAAAVHIDASTNGGGITLTGGDQNDSVYFENSPLQLEKISAPTTTTDKLYNVGGTLLWNGAVLATAAKASVQVGAFIASGSAISSDGSHSSTTPLLSNVGGLNLEGLVDGPAQVDIFVNGQLLLSGTAAQVGTGTADYHLFHTGSAKFGFNLEANDVVTFFKR